MESKTANISGEPYTLRGVRTVRGRVQENLPIAILARRQVLILRYYQNAKSYKDEESKFKSIMYGTALQKGQRAFELCTAFAESGTAIFN